MLIETQIIYNYLLSQFGINFLTKILWIVVVLDLIFFPLMKVEIDFEVSVLVHLPSPHLQTEKFNEFVSHIIWSMKYLLVGMILFFVPDKLVLFFENSSAVTFE